MFNTLQARGVISVAERQAYIGRVRDLAKGSCARGWRHGPSGGKGRGEAAMSADFLLETALLRGNPGADAGQGARRSRAAVRRARLADAGLKAERDRALRDAAAAGADRARRCPSRPQAVREEIKGPRASAPPQALEGFLRKTGLTRDQLEERDGVLFAVIDKPGRATRRGARRGDPRDRPRLPLAQVDALGRRLGQHRQPALGAPAARHRRPARRGDRAGRDRRHRSGRGDGRPPLPPSRRRSPSAARDDYAEKLRACHVIVDQRGARAAHRDGATTAAREGRPDAGRGRGAGGRECRADRMAGAAARPLRPGLPRRAARGDRAHHAHQPEIFRLPTDGGGASSAPAFVCIANIDANDGGAAIVEGNRKVLAARLSRRALLLGAGPQGPARGAGEEARRRSSSTKSSAPSPTRSSASRSWRAGWSRRGSSAPLPSRERAAREASGERGRPASSAPDTLSLGRSRGLSLSRKGRGAQLGRPSPNSAARLCKADLVTGMVGEFPELQGVMGGYYARAQGEPDPQVADAIRDHYKPVGQGDEVPTAPVTVAVSLADKLDTLGCILRDRRAANRLERSVRASPGCRLQRSSERQSVARATRCRCVIDDVLNALAWFRQTSGSGSKRDVRSKSA